MLFVSNSTPIVDLDSRLNSLRVNRESKLDFPTPESPIRTTKQTKYESLKKNFLVCKESITFEKVIVFLFFCHFLTARVSGGVADP